MTERKTSNPAGGWEAFKRQASTQLPFNPFVQDERDCQGRTEHLAGLSDDWRQAEEAKADVANLKAAISAPPPVESVRAIRLEFAMNSDTETTKFDYLVDPFLPSNCVVGLFGRGATAKSSFAATMAVQISPAYSTLWVSVEEPKDWIKVRHIKAGGDQGTLVAVAAVASKTDNQGRVVQSNFDIYEHLEAAIAKAKQECERVYYRPRPLKLVVLDTAVGLTAWRKGESPNDDASVKRLLALLQSLAERFEVTIIIIGHSNKGKHDYFADTVAGATAWTNSPRLSFIHARDVRQEYSCVLRVAKSNITTRFAATYHTVPIHTLYKRGEGADSVLCRVEIGELVWGEDASMDLFKDATRKARIDGDDTGGVGHKVTLVEKAVEAVVLVHSTNEPATREQVHQRLGREISRREWAKIDARLRIQEFLLKVVIGTGPQNKAIYRKQTRD
ncbi:AAA family ATPase [Sphingomonas xanthus]|uniref:AAA family ATPase n=1 Tax=Sphingomonas xanthus TaxID=2594473 RepID=UPI00164DB365|nr:AAA family ATPase [Sphingomonas xanthus]